MGHADAISIVISRLRFQARSACTAACSGDAPCRGCNHHLRQAPVHPTQITGANCHLPKSEKFLHFGFAVRK
jgi:hypothetical protein